MAFLRRKSIETAAEIAEETSCYCVLALVALILLCSLEEGPATEVVGETVKGKQLVGRPCEEIYVVGEGETLHTISDKCGDPFIVERNPHIHDPDDVFPGLVIKLEPYKSTQ